MGARISYKRGGTKRAFSCVDFFGKLDLSAAIVAFAETGFFGRKLG